MQCRKLWTQDDFAAARAVTGEHWECPEECKVERALRREGELGVQEWEVV